MDLSADRFTGCLLGLATGDALGAPYEGGPFERLVWWFIGRTPDGCLRWTDDTQMALDLAESLLERGEVHPESLARRLAASYRWSRGYGTGAARLATRSWMSPRGYSSGTCDPPVSNQAVYRSPRSKLLLRLHRPPRLPAGELGS